MKSAVNFRIKMFYKIQNFIFLNSNYYYQNIYRLKKTHKKIALNFITLSFRLPKFYYLSIPVFFLHNKK